MNPLRSALHQLVHRNEVRLALVVRKDANLSPGSLASQCAEAAINAYKLAATRAPDSLRQWDAMGEPKVVLKAADADEMKALRLKADELNVLINCVYNEGTEDPTVVGFGPKDRDTLDLVTKHLKLF